MCGRPTNDWDLAPGSFLPLGMSSSTSQILLKAARTPNCGPLQTPTTGVKLDLGFLASVGQRTHTLALAKAQAAAKPRTPCTNDLRSPVSHKINSFQRTEKRRIGHGRHTLTQLSQAGRALRPPRPQNGLHTQTNEKFSQRLANNINAVAAGPRVGRRRDLCRNDEGKRTSIFCRRITV